MFFGKINAPATLPIYVIMHLVNSKFLGWLYTSSRRLFFLMLYNKAFLLLLRNVTQSRPAEKITLWSLIHTAKHTVTWCIYVLQFASY